MVTPILAMAVVGNLFLAVQNQGPASGSSAIFGAWVLLDSEAADELRPPLRLIISGDADGVAMTQYGIGAEQVTGRLSLIPFEVEYPYRRGFIATNRRAQWAGDALVTSLLNNRQTVTYRVNSKGLLVVETRFADSDPSPRIARYVRDEPYSK
jgi:hypothetical protein